MWRRRAVRVGERHAVGVEAGLRVGDEDAVGPPAVEDARPPVRSDRPRGSASRGRISRTELCSSAASSAARWSSSTTSYGGAASASRSAPARHSRTAHRRRARIRATRAPMSCSTDARECAAVVPQAADVRSDGRESHGRSTACERPATRTPHSRRERACSPASNAHAAVIALGAGPHARAREGFGPRDAGPRLFPRRPLRGGRGGVPGRARARARQRLRALRPRPVPPAGRRPRPRARPSAPRHRDAARERRLPGGARTGPSPTPSTRDVRRRLRSRRRHLARRGRHPGRGRRHRRAARGRLPRRVPDEQLERHASPTTWLGSRSFGITADGRRCRRAARRRRPRCSPANSPRAHACTRARGRAWSRRSRRADSFAVDERARPTPSSWAGTATFDFERLRARRRRRAPGRALRRDQPRPDLSGRDRLAPGRGIARGRGVDRVGAHAAGRGQARAGDGRVRVRALRDRRGDDRRSSVDRRRVRRRARMAVRARAVGRRGHVGRGSVPDPPPPFVAADLAELAPRARRRVRAGSAVGLSSRACRVRAARGGKPKNAFRPSANDGAEREPADVRERRDPAARLREELQHEPEAEHDRRR